MEEYGDSGEMNSLTSLDQDQISEWLDSHPEFLNNYIRRLQRQRRSSIINDQSSLLLANLKPTDFINSRNPSIVTTSSNEYDLANEFATSFQNALNATSSSSNSSETTTNKTAANYARAESAIDAVSCHAASSYLADRSLNKSLNISQKDKSSLLFKSNLNSNASHSEPNLQPADLPSVGSSLNSSSQAPASTKDITRAVRKHRYHAMQQQQQMFNLQQMQQFQLQLQLQQKAHAHHSDSEDSNKQLKPTDQDLVPRKEFKQLSLYEKMYTLVKTLYRSLNLKTTCKKILNTVSLLLDADRCSLFLVVDDEDSVDKKCLVSVVFDAQSSSSLNTLESKGGESKAGSADTRSEENGENDNGQIKIPFNYGIAGFVASTGKPLNILNAYKDERFNPAIDLKTGYKTKSILCLPILNENNECIAVAEAINKISDNEDSQQNESGFTKEDEETFGQFMPFIAIAIRNSNLYYESRKEAQTNKVLLELATIVFDESSTTVDNLVSRILFYSILLLECERCQVVLLNNNPTSTRRQQNINSYFDRIYELNSSELGSDDAISPGVPIKPYNANYTNNSPEVHIINTVIQSGQILNIKNLNEDPKYSSLAEHTKTTSLLCIPVNNSANQVLALIFAYNKSSASNLNFFSTPDINVAKAFALFCGIGIQNIMMYEKVVRAMNMQQVALDVLSYHTSSNQDEVDRLVEEPIPDPLNLGLISFNFDENTLDDIGTLKGCISMFGDLGLIEKFNIPYEILCRFFLTVKKNYRPVAYHNWRHGFNVMSSMYQMFKIAKYLDVFNDLEVLSLLIACICHDLDHRGTTNNFQIKIQSPLAKLYTTSTMEHHHFNQCIIILHNNMNNILTNLSPSEHSEAIDIVEKAIIATDLSLHFQHIDKFLEKANSGDHSFETPEEKDLLLNMLMTACDLSGGAKPWKCHNRLSNLVSNEFFNEGDLEKEKFKMEPIDSKNRSKSREMPKMQIQFLQSVCIPLYRGFSLCNPILEPLVIACEDNVKEWQKLIQTQQAEIENGSQN